MKLEDCNPGDAVRYVPTHAGGDVSHPDCENGIVLRRNDRFVFVHYYERINGVESAGLQFTPKATNPKDLVK